MAIKKFKSPFHVTHDDSTANKMSLKMDLSIFITRLIREKQWTQSQASEVLGIQQSRISEIMNGKIEQFTVDVFIDLLEKLGFDLTSKPSNSLDDFSIKLISTAA